MLHVQSHWLGNLLEDIDMSVKPESEIPIPTDYSGNHTTYFFEKKPLAFQSFSRATGRYRGHRKRCALTPNAGSSASTSGNVAVERSASTSLTLTMKVPHTRQELTMRRASPVMIRTILSNHEMPANKSSTMCILYSPAPQRRSQVAMGSQHQKSK